MNQLKTQGNFTLLAIASLTIMVGCVIVPGLGNIAKNLGVPDAASWMVTLPSLGVVLFGPWAGSLIQRQGPYKALIIGLVLYGFLGAVAIFLHGLVAIVIDRLLLGGATAMVMASGTGLISTFYIGQKRLKMIAIQGMSIELGGVIFLSAGGLLATLGWQWPFVLYLMAWVFLIMLLCFVPSPKDAAETGTMVNEFDQIHEIRPGALFPVYFSALFAMILFFVAVIFLPQRLQGIGFSQAETGYFLSFISIMAVCAASQLPKVIARLHEWGTLYCALLLYALAHAAFFFANQTLLFILGAVLMGAGFGLSIPLVNHMTVEQSPECCRGRNLAYLSVALFLGQFLSAFMDFLPGNGKTPFLAAGALSIVILITLQFLHKKQQLRTEQC